MNSILSGVKEKWSPESVQKRRVKEVWEECLSVIFGQGAITWTKSGGYGRDMKVYTMSFFAGYISVAFPTTDRSKSVLQAGRADLTESHNSTYIKAPRLGNLTVTTFYTDATELEAYKSFLSALSEKRETEKQPRQLESASSILMFKNGWTPLNPDDEKIFCKDWMQMLYADQKKSLVLSECYDYIFRVTHPYGDVSLR